MRRIIGLFVLACSVTGVAAADEDSVFVYDVFRGNPGCTEIAATLRSLPLQGTVILSVEQGPELILDRPGGENTLLCAIDTLQSAGHRVKVMTLQDASFLVNQEEALRRVKKVSAFAAAHHQKISSTVIDLEPYTDERWDCASPDERRSIAVRFRDLVGRLREQTRPLPLEMVVPWWFAVVPEYPAFSLQSLGAVSDGIFLMLYGDEGGPVVGGDGARLKARMDLVLQAGMSRTPLYIALATFEYGSPAELQRELGNLRVQHGPLPQFAGMSIFHAQGRFGVPLVRMATGTVTDTAGQAVAGARIAVLDQVAETNSCGHFTIRDLNAAAASLTISKPGYQTAHVDAQFAEPGRLKELQPVVLQSGTGR